MRSWGRIQKATRRMSRNLLSTHHFGHDNTHETHELLAEWKAIRANYLWSKPKLRFYHRYIASSLGIPRENIQSTSPGMGLVGWKRAYSHHIPKHLISSEKNPSSVKNVYSREKYIPRGFIDPLYSLLTEQLWMKTIIYCASCESWGISRISDQLNRFPAGAIRQLPGR